MSMGCVVFKNIFLLNHCTRNSNIYYFQKLVYKEQIINCILTPGRKLGPHINMKENVWNTFFWRTTAPEMLIFIQKLVVLLKSKYCDHRRKKTAAPRRVQTLSQKGIGICLKIFFSRTTASEIPNLNKNLFL